MGTVAVNNRKNVDRALSNAIASVKMEGYVFPDSHKKLCEEVVLGNITKQECIERLLANRS